MNLPSVSDNLYTGKWVILIGTTEITLPETLHFTTGDVYPDYNSVAFRKDYQVILYHKGDTQPKANHLVLVNGFIESQSAIIDMYALDEKIRTATKLIRYEGLNKQQWDLEPEYSYVFNDRPGRSNRLYLFDIKFAVKQLEPIAVP